MNLFKGYMLRPAWPNSVPKTSKIVGYGDRLLLCHPRYRRLTPNWSGTWECASPGEMDRRIDMVRQESACQAAEGRNAFAHDEKGQVGPFLTLPLSIDCGQTVPCLGST